MYLFNKMPFQGLTAILFRIDNCKIIAGIEYIQKCQLLKYNTLHYDN